MFFNVFEAAPENDRDGPAQQQQQNKPRNTPMRLARRFADALGYRPLSEDGLDAPLGDVVDPKQDHLLDLHHRPTVS